MTGTTLFSHSSNSASMVSTASAPRAKSSVWKLVITGVLSVIFCLVLIRSGLVIFTSAESGAVLNDVSLTEAAIGQSIDINQLQAGRFFGSGAPALPASYAGSQQELQNSPPAAGETRLNLRLEGVVTGNSATSGFAIIASNNQAETYRVGDRLPAGNRVVLDSIYPDRVMLENNGSVETLWLYAREQNEMNRAAAPARAPNSEGLSLVLGQSYNPIALVNEYQEKFLNNSLSADFLTLSEIVKISPAYENSQMLGYRVSPGDHNTEFVRLGLKTNDIVTRINGIELTDITNMPRLFEVMSTASEITLGLNRAGQALDLQLSLSDLPR